MVFLLIFFFFFDFHIMHPGLTHFPVLQCLASTLVTCHPTLPATTKKKREREREDKQLLPLPHSPLVLLPRTMSGLRENLLLSVAFRESVAWLSGQDGLWVSGSGWVNPTLIVVIHSEARCLLPAPTHSPWNLPLAFLGFFLSIFLPLFLFPNLVFYPIPNTDLISQSKLLHWASLSDLNLRPTT